MKGLVFHVEEFRFFFFFLESSGKSVKSLFFFFFAVPQGMSDPSSLTRDQTHAVKHKEVLKALLN